MRPPLHLAGTWPAGTRTSTSRSHSTGPGSRWSRVSRRSRCRSPTTWPSARPESRGVRVAVAQAEDESLGEHHVYRPHRAGLPPIGTYVRELARRRAFVRELARAELKAQNYNTAFGQAWLVLNPLLNAAVYFFLVDILSSGKGRAPNYITHLLAGIFAYTFFQSGVSQAAGSVVGGGKLILNTAFPRLLLPITQIVIAFFRFLPTLPVLALVMALNNRNHVTWALLLTVPVFALLVLFTSGVGFLCATLQVYNTDFKNLLPYLLRLGLYLTPILWFVRDPVTGQLASGMRRE